MKASNQDETANPMLPKPLVLIVLLIVLLVGLIGCSWLSKHRSAVATEPMAFLAAAPKVVMIPPHGRIRAVPDEEDPAPRHIVEAVRVEHSPQGYRVANDWLPIGTDRAMVRVGRCPRRWVFRIDGRPALWSESFTGALKEMPGPPASDCSEVAAGSDGWNSAAGTPAWQAIMDKHPAWLAADALISTPDALLVRHWSDRWSDRSLWVYRRRDAKRLHELPRPPDPRDHGCIYRRWRPSTAVLAWCRPEQQRTRDGLSAPRSAFWVRSLIELPIEWRSVDSGVPFPDGRWLVDWLSCPEYPGCVRDGRTRERIEWLGKLEHPWPILQPKELAHEALPTFGRWHLSVHGKVFQRPCARSKVGCVSRTGPLQLRITDVASGKRTWIPVDGHEDISELGLKPKGFQPYWAFDGSIYAKAASENADGWKPDILFIGRASTGLERRALPPGLTDLRFTSQTHGVGAGPGLMVWTTDGGRTWTEIRELPPWFPSAPSVRCDEVGCYARGVWVDWRGGGS